MSLKQEEYNQMAIEWAEKYISENETIIDLISFDGIIIHNTHYTFRIWIQRLKDSRSREQEASFLKIKKFKDWYNKQHGIQQ
jgi:cytochrome c oxidase assembly factor CtaG